MEKIFKNRILDDLYDIRGSDFANVYIETYGEPEEMKKYNESENELRKFIENAIQDENIIEEIYQKLDNFCENFQDSMSFWNQQFYKLGCTDGILLKQESKELNEIMQKKNKNGG